MLAGMSPGCTARAAKIPQSVLVVIHTPALEVLLIERADKPGFWQSVTGSKDRLDEPLVETCVREVAEETGIVIGSAAVPLAALRDWGLRNVYEIYPVWRHRYAAGVTHNTEHVFGLTVPRRHAGAPEPARAPALRLAAVARGGRPLLLAEQRRGHPATAALPACSKRHESVRIAWLRRLDGA